MSEWIEVKMDYTVFMKIASIIYGYSNFLRLVSINPQSTGNSLDYPREETV